MLGAGACERIYLQLRKFPIDVVGSYGMQQSTVIDGEFKLIRNDFYSVSREYFETQAKKLREELDLNDFYGDSVEYHASGLVTFPVLGTKAPLSEKLAYDPDRIKRRAMYGAVKRAFRDYNVFIGGSSSFDISRGQYNKFFALERYCAENALRLDEVLFVGDDFGEGGNDSAVKDGGVDYVEIDDYTKFPERIRFLLD